MPTTEKNYLEEPIIWNAGVDAEYPYESAHEGSRLTLRINDFPDDHMYTLLIDGLERISFDDWPANWIQPKDVRNSAEHAEKNLWEALYEVLKGLTDEESRLLYLWIKEASVEEFIQILDKEVPLVRQDWDKLKARLRSRARKLRREETWSR